MKRKRPTDKQKIFCDEYLKSFNVADASRKANYIARTGYNILQKLHIQEYLRKKTKKATENTELKLEEIINNLKSIAFDDIGNYLEYRTEKTVVGIDDKTGDPIIDYAQIVDLKDSKDINTKNIAEISNTTQGFKFKLYQRDKALNRLLDYLEKAEEQASSPETVDFEFEEIE